MTTVGTLSKGKGKGEEDAAMDMESPSKGKGKGEEDAAMGSEPSKGKGKCEGPFEEN